jgi:Asp-tRNA(Asn)/Glu-tRNA(Gln) amidotransferase B subunit
MGESPAQQQATSITLNQKFVHAGIDPQKLAELIKARQARVITERMFLEALERDEELGEQTIDEIIEDLQSESDVEDERREMQAATANANLTAKAMMAQMNGGQPT